MLAVCAADVTISELEKLGVAPMDFRYLCHTALYRMPLNYTAESLKSAHNSLSGLVDFGRNAQTWPAKDAAWTESYRQEFRNAIADDLNVPQALAVVWSVVKEGNKREDRAAWDALLDFDRVLGLGLAAPKTHVITVVAASSVGDVRIGSAPVGTPQEVLDLANRRQEARTTRNWSEADRLRAEIAERGYMIEDIGTGYRL